MKIPMLIIKSVIALCVPLAIIMFFARLLMTPVFLEVEYRMPGFPDDSYGFSMQDRLKWAKPSVDYLVNNEGINFLSDLKFESGSPIYIDRELSHMADVKKVVKQLLTNWYVDLAILTLLFLVARMRGWMNEYLEAIRYGGLLTVGLLVSLGIFAATSFWQFFAWFHSLFFSGNSWIFEYSDTLIRLFPLRFWMDAVLYIVLFSLVLGFSVWWFLKPAGKKGVN